MAAIKGTIQDHKEWRRTGYVTAEENLETYNPDADPTVRRWRREDEERQATESAARRRATENAVDHQGAADPAAQAVLTALARAGLYDLGEDDHQAVEQLTALLDEATIAQVVSWLERTRAAALHLPPPRGGPSTAVPGPTVDPNTPENGQPVTAQGRPQGRPGGRDLVQGAWPER